MEDGELEQFKSQFEFHTRRAITEAAPHRAACRYDSADDNEEEELAVNGADFFDLNMLPDQMPQDLYSQNVNKTSKLGPSQGLLNFRHIHRQDHMQNYQEPPLRITNKNTRGSPLESSRGVLEQNNLNNGGNANSTMITNFAIGLQGSNGLLGKPLKHSNFGVSGQIPGKVFTSNGVGKPSYYSSCYNSQKQLRPKAENCNQTMNGAGCTSTVNYGNNRYSSQNMKGGASDFDEDEEQIDEQDNALDVADENCVSSKQDQNCTQTADGRGYVQSNLQTEVCFNDSAPETLSQTYRRGSYRYKDRINTLRMQSKETYQRENMIGPTYFTQINDNLNNENQNQCDTTDQNVSIRKGKKSARKQTKLYQGNNQDEGCEADEFDLFERAENIYSQRSRYQNNYTQSQMNNQSYKINEKQTNHQQYQNDFPGLIKKGSQSRYDDQNVSGFAISGAKRWTTQPVSNCNDDDYYENEKIMYNNQDEKQNQDYDGDATPKQDMSQLFVDPKSGAHFQYKELIKRLSDMTNNSSKDKKSSSKKSHRLQKGRVKQHETENRIPLKEKTQEIMNQPQVTSSQKKKKYSQTAGIDPSSKMRPYCNSAKNMKKDASKKVAVNQGNPLQNLMTETNTQNFNGNQKILNQSSFTQTIASQNKIAKLLLNNQENHFIDRKLKDLHNHSKEQQLQSQNQLMNQTKIVNNINNLSKNMTLNHHNKSHQNLHKSIEKTYQKMSSLTGQNQQACQINNMKLNKGQLTTATQQKQVALHSNGVNATQMLKNHTLAHQTIVQQQQIIINNILSSNALSSSISSSSTGNGCASSTNQYAAIQQQTMGSISGGGGTFSSCAKCPSSSNMLRTATTAAFTTSTTNKSSAKLTQCNSNKQISSSGQGGLGGISANGNSINNKETPEATSRQKFRLTGTALSSTSKRNAGQINSAGGLGQNPVTSTLGTLSNNSQGNTIQNSHSSMQALIQQHQQQLMLGQYAIGGSSGNNVGFGDSANKRSQNSDHKEMQNVTIKSNNGTTLHPQVNSGVNTHPSSVPRSNSSNKKVQVQKMIKNQSFLKGSTEGHKIEAGPNKKQTNTEFYNTVLQNLQTGKLGLSTLSGGSSQSQLNLNLKQNSKVSNQNFIGNQQFQLQSTAPFAQANPAAIQPRLSETKKQSILAQSSKTTRVSGAGATGQHQHQFNQIPLGIPNNNAAQNSSKPQSRLSQGKKKGCESNRAAPINHNQISIVPQNLEVDGGLNQITSNIKRISDLLQAAHQQSPTSQLDNYSRKNSNKNLKEDEQLQHQPLDKSTLRKTSGQNIQVQRQGMNIQKSSQFFMKINQEQQQFLANQSQNQIKSNQGSSTNLTQQINQQKPALQDMNSNQQNLIQLHQPNSILLSHQVNKKISNQTQNRMMTFSNPTSAMNTGRPYSNHSNNQNTQNIEGSNQNQIGFYHDLQNFEVAHQKESSFIGDQNQFQIANNNYLAQQQLYTEPINNPQLNLQQSQNIINSGKSNNANNNAAGIQSHQDNRQSLMVQHKTMEKKAAANSNSNHQSSQLTSHQQQYQQKLTQNQREKRKQFIQQKKDEMAQAVNATRSNPQNINRASNVSNKNNNGGYAQTQYSNLQTQISQNDQSLIGPTGSAQAQSKKGFLLTNIKIPKGGNQNSNGQQTKQQNLMTQQNEQDLSTLNNNAYERMHMPTEEDDYCNPTSFSGIAASKMTHGGVQSNLLTQMHYQKDLNNQQLQNVVMTEVIQSNNLMETEGDDQYEILSNKVSQNPHNVSGSYLAQQQQKNSINQMSKIQHQASRYAGAASKHSVKVKPKHF